MTLTKLLLTSLQQKQWLRVSLYHRTLDYLWYAWLFFYFAATPETNPVSALSFFRRNRLVRYSTKVGQG